MLTCSFHFSFVSKITPSILVELTNLSALFPRLIVGIFCSLCLENKIHSVFVDENLKPVHLQKLSSVSRAEFMHFLVDSIFLPLHRSVISSAYTLVLIGC